MLDWLHKNSQEQLIQLIGLYVKARHTSVRNGVEGAVGMLRVASYARALA